MKFIALYPAVAVSNLGFSEAVERLGGGPGLLFTNGRTVAQARDLVREMGLNWLVVQAEVGNEGGWCLVNGMGLMLSEL